MNAARGIAIAGAMIAAAILARGLMAQATTTSFATGLVVATCGTAPVLPGSSPWSYAAGNQAPLTLSTGGALCVNQ